MKHAIPTLTLLAITIFAGCVVETLEPEDRLAPTPVAPDAAVIPIDGGAADGGGPDGMCCVTDCCVTEQQPPFEGEPSDFECPVGDMPYCDGFDCDDFSLACKLWCDHNDINACQVTVVIDKPGDDDTGHALNAVEFDYPYSTELTKWCLVEPQDNSIYCCWIQDVGDPEPPQHCIDEVCTRFGGETGADHCVSEVWCEPTHCSNAGEACFLTDEDMCELFEAETGVCIADFQRTPE